MLWRGEILLALPYTPATPTHSRYTTTPTHPPLLRYLKHPLLIKNFLEKKFSHMTGAQSYMLLYDLKESMLENSGTISLLEFPSDASIAARKRKPFSARLDALPQIVTLARAELADQLGVRIFGTQYEDRPSDTRLIQIYMSKQVVPHLCRTCVCTSLVCSYLVFANNDRCQLTKFSNLVCLRALGLSTCKSSAQHR